MKLEQSNADTSSEIRKFLSSGRTPIFKFKGVGDRIKGVIAEGPKLLPLTQFGSTDPKLDADGNQVMQLLLVLTVGDSKQRVYIDKPLLREKLGRAIEDSGADDLAVGGTVEIVRVDDVKCQNGGTAHDFTVTYEPPPADDWGAPF